MRTEKTIPFCNGSAGEQKLLETLGQPSESLSPEENETKKQVRGSTLLLIGRFLAMAINLSSQILLVRCLSKSGYGAFAYALSMVSLGSSIACFGLEKSVSRFVAIYQEQQDHGRVLGTIFLMFGTMLLLGLAIVLVVLGLRNSLLPWLIRDREAANVLIVLVALSPIQALESLFTGLFSAFAKPRAIFFRRYLVGPSLYFVVVLLLLLGGYDTEVVATGYLVAGFVGALISITTFAHILLQKGLLTRTNLGMIKLPILEVFRFTTPLFVSDVVFMLRAQFVVFLLEYFKSTTEVATYRSVLPVARFNVLVYQNFLILFLPVASRMFARKENDGMDNLYQQTAVWIAVISFPVFAVTSSLSKPLTTLLFGQRYADSAIVLTLLSLGFYFSAALGFNGQTLRVFGRVRYVFLADLTIAVVSIIVSLLLIPRYGALGAALSVCGTLILQNILYQLGLMARVGFGWFSREYLKVYLIIALAWAALFLLPPLHLSFVVAGIVSLLVFRFNRKLLNIDRTFPELLRFPLMRRLFGN